MFQNSNVPEFNGVFDRLLTVKGKMVRNISVNQLNSYDIDF
jgi:hypothetical protein